ncbi:squalene/phytoene synthase family protein [Terasakiella sp. SH-1]|uniref:squalene/phytoene synthase family protein n=1 Tax=Terasakiella sp. SH-1 TaxID=2560057 RepID=UPI0010731910|nr:squalene/phytoene synthase family protein [Terasakiella sp. SH-1]
MTDLLSLCAQEIHAHDHDQFLCGLFVSEDHREAFYALQIFYRETARIRDMVTEPHMRLMRLQWWRDLIADIYAGRAPNVETGMHKEIIAALKARNIEQDLFDRYFNARQFDMEDRVHDDMASLRRYSEATGGTIAQIKEQAIGLSPTDAALKVGAAGTLAGMLQTIAFQARHNRCKIPTALVKKHQLSLKSVMELTCTAALKGCVKEIVAECCKLIKEARECKVETNPVLLSTIAIEDYLTRLEKVGFDPFNPNLGNGRLIKQIKLGFKAWRGSY